MNGNLPQSVLEPSSSHGLAAPVSHSASRPPATPTLVIKYMVVVASMNGVIQPTEKYVATYTLPPRVPISEMRYLPTDTCANSYTCSLQRIADVVQLSHI